MIRPLELPHHTKRYEGQKVPRSPHDPTPLSFLTFAIHLSHCTHVVLLSVYSHRCSSSVHQALLSLTCSRDETSLRDMSRSSVLLCYTHECIDKESGSRFPLFAAKAFHLQWQVSAQTHKFICSFWFSE